MVAATATIACAPTTDQRPAAAPGAPSPWPSGSSIAITPRETRVISPDWVYEFGTSVVTYTPAGAQAPQELNSTYLVLLHRTADGWRLHGDVASSNRPPE